MILLRITAKQYIASAFLIVFGVMLLTLKFYSIPVPFYDEWDAEASWLYRLYELGTLELADVFAPHNGHRLPLTRLTALALYILNGGWDPQLQMIINGLLHAIICSVLVSILICQNYFSNSALPFFATVILFAIPFSWLSILVAFQTQFYFMMLFSVLAIHYLSSEKYFAGYSYAALAMLSMTPGAFALPAIIAMILVDALNKRSITKTQLRHVFICSIVFLLFILALPVEPSAEAYKAQNLRGFVVTVLATVSWPFLIRDGIGILIYVPLTIFILRALFKEPVPRFLLASGFFIILQILAIGYFRGQAGAIPPNRYWEILIVGLWINGMSLAYLVNFTSSQIVKLLALVWLTIVAIGMNTIAVETFTKGLPDHKRNSLIAQTLASEYVKTGNQEVFVGRTGFEISYPNATALITILDRPITKELLPSSLGGPSKDYLAAIKATLFDLHWLVVLLGILVLFPFSWPHKNPREDTFKK